MKINSNIYKRQLKNSLSRSYLLLVLTLISIFISCDAFIEVPLPDSELVGGMVFEDALTAEAALIDIYADIREYGMVSGKGLGIGVLMGHYADELDYYSSTGLAAEDFYNNNVLPTNTTIEGIWKVAYKEIYAANSLLEGIAISDNIPPDTQAQLKGEALFLRSFIHFHITNLFDAVPYISTTDYRQNSKVIKKDRKEVYKSIIGDLVKAKSLIGADYPTPDRTRANKAVVSALLARVYLYDKQYQNAFTEASMVITNNRYHWENDLRQVFTVGSGTAIWQLSPQGTEQNAEEGRTYFFETLPPPNWALSPVLLQQFSSVDLRARNWMEGISNEVETFYRPNKYMQVGTSGTSLEYSVIFRMAEQYLIRAEANVHLGNLDTALEDLNKIRQRAGIGNLEVSNSNSLIDSILTERNRELFTEQGHRWFDLKRFGRASETLKTVKSGWRTADTILPLPDKELLINPNLNPQNPGY